LIDLMYNFNFYNFFKNMSENVYKIYYLMITVLN
jgi:hypothetical protein